MKTSEFNLWVAALEGKVKLESKYLAYDPKNLCELRSARQRLTALLWLVAEGRMKSSLIPSTDKQILGISLSTKQRAGGPP